ncbi:MAG: hypothetical protein AB7I27_12365 [Bacteriovoracaceae bacterium]
MNIMILVENVFVFTFPRIIYDCIQISKNNNALALLATAKGKGYRF